MAKQNKRSFGGFVALSSFLTSFVIPPFAYSEPVAADPGVQASSQGSQASPVVFSGTNVIDFANHQDAEFKVTGDLINSGVLYAISSNPAITSAVFSAANIVNQSGATITSVLPAGGLPGYANAIPGLNLVFNTSNNFTNQGIITSAGSLSIMAGGNIVNALPQAISAPPPLMQALGGIDLHSQLGNILNSGTIIANTGNININAASANALAINGIGGIMQALQGNINVRDTLYNGSQILDIVGGDWLSDNLNVFNGKAAISAQFNSVSGVLNAFGNGAQIGVLLGDLRLGDIKADGDPIYYSATGNVTLPAVINTTGEDLAVIAAQNVLSAGTTINTVGATKSGNVLIVAGAKFLNPTVGDGLPAGAGFSVSFTSPDSLVDTGGSIIPAFLNITTGGANFDAGNVTMIAYEGQAAGSGQIAPTNPGASVINAKANSGFGGGSVLMIAGISSDQAISWGGITAGGNNAVLELYAANPVINGSGQITVIDGSPQAGSGAYIAGAQTLGNIEIASLFNDGNAGGLLNDNDGAPGGSISVQTGGELYITNLSSQGGQGSKDTSGKGGKAGGAGGTVNLSAAIIDLGLLNLSGGQGGDGGHIGSVATPGGKGGNAGMLLANASTSFTAGSMQASGGAGGAPATVADFTLLTNNASGGNGGSIQITAPDISLGNSGDILLNGGAGGAGAGTMFQGGLGFGGGNGGTFIANASATFQNFTNMEAKGGNAGAGGSIVLPIGPGGSSVGPGGGGGSINIVAGDTISLGNIDVSGGNGAAGGDGVVAGAASAGGKGGSIVLNAANGLFTGDFSTVGGNGGDNSALTGHLLNGASGGQGGTITLSGTACCIGNLDLSGGNGGGGGSLGGAAGAGGKLSIQSSQYIDVLDVLANSGISGTGSLVGNGANGGSINMTALTDEILVSSITARGYGTTDGAPNMGGSVTLTSSVAVSSFDAIEARGEAGANGGVINVSAPELFLNGVNFAGNSLDVGSDLASGGRISLTTLGPDPLTNSGCGCNLISGGIEASGAINGGRIDLAASGGFYFESGISIRANGGTGTGGLIQFSSPGNSSVNMYNQAEISATNGAGDSGRIGFNAGPSGAVSIDGAFGIMTAGDFIALGNLNPATLDPVNPLEVTLAELSPPGTGGFQMLQGTAGNRIFISRPLPQDAGASSTVSSSRGQIPVVLPDLPKLNNSTITNIDQTPFIVSIRDPRKLTAGDAKGFLSGVPACKLADALGSPELSLLQGENGNLILGKGNLLLLPQEGIDAAFVIETQEGTLTVAPGAIAFLIETGNDVAVFALHECQRGGISFKSGERSVELATGQEAVFTRSKASFDKINPGALIPSRKVMSYQMGNGVTAHIADYSIPMALSVIRPLKELRAASDRRSKRVSGAVQKNAAIMSMLGMRFGPYSRPSQQ